MVRALTFDLWDTLVVDDSDEDVRAELDLPTKVEARRERFLAEVLRHHDLPPWTVAEALELADHAFHDVWTTQHRTPALRERLADAYGHLGIAPTPGFDALVDAWAHMEVVIPPKPVEGIHEALETLSRRFPMAIVSDAIVTPGAQLRQLLAKHDLLRFFDHCVFSDEAGASKPDPRVFHLAAEALGVAPEALLHVGDREANDVAGPKGVGAKAVLFTGSVDRGTRGTAADAVAHDAASLVAAITALTEAA